jgi:branched-chain amino acid transport system permease protein
MSAATVYYLSGLVILFGINLIAIWGLDLHFGFAGINSFAFILFQSIGAYVTGVLSLGPAHPALTFETYILGTSWPWPLALLCGGIAGALLAVPIGLIAVRRLRGDYQAMGMLVLALVAYDLVSSQINWFNGPSGLESVPQPFGDVNASLYSYHWIFAGLTAVCCVVAWWITRSISRAPLGRTLRAVRDSDSAVAALGRNPTRLRMIALLAGGFLGGLSGGLLVEYVTAWAPGSWVYAETFLFFTALIVGGRGNMLGAALGTLIVPIGIVEATRELPQIGYPGEIDDFQWIAIGALLLAFLWFRPNGLIPERKRVYRRPGEPAPPRLSGLLLRLRRTPAP